MRQVQVYIEGKKIELFEDEQINVTSSVQNIADISKVFTDFSQSFTVPASPHNNAIFQHFYQSDVDSTIDHNIRRSAIIEIDLTTFRRGKIQIEKSNIKNNLVENYQLTFYGEIRTLKDRFGEDKLNQLDLTQFEFPYTGADILDRITDVATDYVVRYPLIASDRLWAYQSSGEDVTNTSHSIKFNELFPAIKVSKLFEAIENDYGVNFTGTFLTDPKFTNVFLYAKNGNQNNFISAPVDVDFTSKTNINSQYWDRNYNAEDFVSTTKNNIGVNYLSGSGFTLSKITVNITSKSAAGTIYIDVYLNGNFYVTLQTTTTGLVGNGLTFINTDYGNFTFKYRVSAPMTINAVITYQIKSSKYLLPPITSPPGTFGTYVDISSTATIQTAQVTVSTNVSINNTLPDMKIADFLAGILKEFNATCVAKSQNTFEVLPLEDWYSQGAIVDITEYTDIDSIDVERIKLYKKIGFKYQQSESFVNRQYFKISNSEYGDITYQFPYDGDEYNIEVPFENLLFARAEKTGDSSKYAIFGYCLNENYQAYTPKPVLLYLYGESNDLSAHPIKFFNGTGHDNIDSFAQFGQDLTYQGTKYSLNFGQDNSIIHLESISQGLYAQYYLPYLNNLFNLKNRLVNVKTNLPVSLLTSLQLNDRIIIRDKRYIINEMKSNLTTGDVNFSLYLDFRPVISTQIIEIDNEAQCVDVPINFINGAVSAEVNVVSINPPPTNCDCLTVTIDGEDYTANAIAIYDTLNVYSFVINSTTIYIWYSAGKGWVMTTTGYGSVTYPEAAYSDSNGITCPDSIENEFEWVNVLFITLEPIITRKCTGVTVTPDTLTTSGTVSVCVPENLFANAYILAENSDFIITEDFNNLTTEESSTQIVVLNITYTLQDGTQVTQQQIVIIQQ